MIKFYKTLSKSLENKFNQLLDEAFNYKKNFTTKEKIEENDKFCSKKNHLGYLLAIEQETIIGGLIILKRNLLFKEKNLALGGFGGVCVQKDKQRKGVATLLLKRGIKILKDNHCNMAYLCTDINKLKHLYGHVGFIALKRPHTYLGKSGKRYTENDAMIAPVNSLKKFKAVLLNKEPFDIGTGNW